MRSMATGGTDNHLVLWDLRPLNLTGSKMEVLCDKVGITLNKNSIYGDRSAMSPGGVRIGTVRAVCCHCCCYLFVRSRVSVYVACSPR